MSPPPAPPAPPVVVALLLVVVLVVPEPLAAVVSALVLALSSPHPAARPTMSVSAMRDFMAAHRKRASWCAAANPVANSCCY